MQFDEIGKEAEIGVVCRRRIEREYLVDAELRGGLRAEHHDEKDDGIFNS